MTRDNDEERSGNGFGKWFVACTLIGLGIIGKEHVKAYMNREVEAIMPVAEATQPAQITVRKAPKKVVNEDELYLANILFKEGSYCAPIEKAGIAYAPKNRLKYPKRYGGSTIKDVVLKPKQFSCFDYDKTILSPEDIQTEYDAVVFAECLQVARGVLSGEIPDPTNGATHYYNPKKANPYWAHSREMVKARKIKTEYGFSEHAFSKEKTEG